VSEKIILLLNYKEKNDMFSFGISEVRGISTFTTLPSFYLFVFCILYIKVLNFVCVYVCVTYKKELYTC
jgi:hypothetical protein